MEIPWGRDSTSNALYRRYLQGSHVLDRTEMQQLGFRVAKLARLPRVCGVDHPLDVNLAGVMVWALTHGQPEVATAAQQLGAWLVAEADSVMKHATVGEILAALNSGRADSAHGIYMAALRVGADTSYLGAVTTARWYERNLRIASNVLRAIDSPGDRVLVSIGAAHGPIPRDIIEGAPGVSVVSIAQIRPAQAHSPAETGRGYSDLNRRFSTMPPERNAGQFPRPLVYRASLTVTVVSR